MDPQTKLLAVAMCSIVNSNVYDFYVSTHLFVLKISQGYR